MNSKTDLLLSPHALYNKMLSEKEEGHALLIRTAIRETAEAMARTTQQEEHAVLLAHLQRLQDLENAVLSMVRMPPTAEDME